jgi:hypothetical protein
MSEITGIAMSLSPLRPPAAPVQDAPRKISTPQQPPAPSAFGIRKGGRHAQTRPSNPALQASTGSSGFDAGARTGGPRIALPAPTGAPESTKGANATAGTSATGSVSSKFIDAMFNKGSSIFEKILGSLGHKDLPQIDDPAAKLQQRSDYLGSLLKADPSLKDQISFADIAKAHRISKIFANPTFYGALSDVQKLAVDSYQGTMCMLRSGEDWPPPPGGGIRGQ